MQFSRRTDWNTEESDLARAHRERVRAGLPIADLTASNPTRCGFAYPADLLAPLSDPAAFDYDPDPKGSLRAREAVCRYYADHGVAIEPGQLVLTTSTSEAYAYLFKLLTDPGDEILAPQPSYPLFDFLADAESVRLGAVPLVYDFGWQLDMEELRRRITDRTRAVVLVHPNNPTGHFTTYPEARELAEICRERGLALIVDEVFLDYGFGEPDPDRDGGRGGDWSSFALRDLSVPVFVVSGISKICGLPQMKAAWVLAVGPGTVAAMARLEVLADTFLSMNAPVQRALPVWLGGREQLQEQIRRRTADNLATLDGLLAGQPPGNVQVNRLRVEGGWYVVLRVPAMLDDEVVALELLDRGVWIHPGSFFGMPGRGWLVASLLPEPEEFSTGFTVLMDYFSRNQDSYQ
jgi:aspartate/methionine/tyrosine aminotransferase